MRMSKTVVHGRIFRVVAALLLAVSPAMAAETADLKAFVQSKVHELKPKVTIDPVLPFYEPGAKVTLTVEPAAGFEFLGWISDAAGTEKKLTITMDRHYVIAPKVKLPKVK
jgi:hypothetical protein